MPRRATPPPPSLSTRPTTKAKQRAFLDALILGLRVGSLNRFTTIPLLRTLRREMRNRPPVKRAPPAADSVTPQKIRQVHILHRRDPDMTNQHIADRLNLNAGRVSEILAGKRT